MNEQVEAAPVAPNAHMGKVRFVKTYYVRGGAPDFWRVRYAISDPPTSGFSHACVILGEKRSTILCPYTLDVFQVPNTCGEIANAVLVEIDPARLGKLITQAWETAVRYGYQKEYQVAAMILAELGQPVPKFIPPPSETKQGESRGGKEVDDAALKVVNPESKRGKVAAFFLNPEPQSIHEAMARLELSRSGVLSHLFCLNRDHGVGYELAHDCARLVVPEGFELFAYEAPVKAEKPVKLNDDGSVHEPKKRTSGKPIVEEALAPIPEPGKRATVARLFVGGFYPVEEAMAKLSLSRSAVLSHLFTINQQNGLGYELSADGTKARLLVPEGFEPFAPKQKRAKKEG